MTKPPSITDSRDLPIQVERAALAKVRALGASAVVVYLDLLEACADAKGGAQLSYDDLASRTGVSRRRVIQIVQMFCEAGIVEKKLGGGRSKASYHLVPVRKRPASPAAGAKKKMPTSQQGVERPGGALIANGTGAMVAPLHSHSETSDALTGETTGAMVAPQDRSSATTGEMGGATTGATPPSALPQSVQSSESKNQNKNKSAKFDDSKIPTFIPRDAWEGYRQMRRAKNGRAPWTAKAFELVLEKLAKFCGEGYDVAAILDNSTINGWTDVYEPKEKVSRGTKTPAVDYPVLKRGAHASR